MDILRRTWQQSVVPTSALMVQAAQSKLLAHFCKGMHIDVRRSSNGLNYIVCKRSAAQGLVIYTSEEPQSSQIAAPSSSSNSGSQKTLLLLHGYGSGLGFFFRNYGHLSNTYDTVVAVDLLGMGGSDRGSIQDAPRISMLSLLYQAVTGNTERVDAYAVPKAMNYFVDSIEEFCKTEGLPSSGLHVAAHSLGGLIAYNYAAKYKSRSEALILISPCGVPKLPSKEVQVPWTQGKAMVNIFKLLWSSNMTPQSILRMAGSRGPGMVSSALNRRFNARWEATELELISDYLYHISAMPASGEYALNALLSPVMYRDAPSNSIKTSVFAKRSIEDFVDAEEGYGRLRIPILMLFGDHDWLSFPGVEAFVQKCRGRGMTMDYKVIPQAGHHLYLDNSDAFHSAVDAFRAKHKL